MNARHCGDRVVELRDEAVEVDAADVGDRVDEMVERLGGAAGKRRKTGCAEGCERGSAAQAMEIGMTPRKADQPSHGEADVQRHVGDVENGHEPAPRQQRGLEIGLHMNAEAALEGHDPLRVHRGTPVSGLVRLQPAD